MKHYLFILVATISSFSSLHAQQLFPYRKGKIWGFCDSAKNIVITPSYQSVEVFTEYNLACVQRNGKFGYINRSGKEVISCRFEYASSFWFPTEVALLNKKYGLIDTTGKAIIAFEYDMITCADEGIAVCSKGKWALFDSNGKELTPFIYSSARPGYYHFTAVELNEKWGFVNKKGKTVVKPKFQEVQPFSPVKLTPAKLNDKWGFINLKGKFVIEPLYNETLRFQPNKLCWVKKDGKWGLINTSGKTVIPFIYSDASYFSEGLSYVEKDEKWGFIDSTGKEVIPFVYDKAFEFSEDFAEVCKGDSCGYINKKNEIVIPLKYQINYGGEFSEGLAEVKQNNRYGFINKAGNIIVPINYDTVADYNSFEDGMGMLMNPGKNDKDANTDELIFYFDRNGTLFYE